jgi:hypothetical protein
VRLKAAFASMSLLLPAATHAQGMPVVPYAANFAQTHLHNQLFVQPGVNAEIRRLNRSDGSLRTESAPLASNSSFNYSADTKQRKVNLDRYIRDLSTKDPVGAQSLATLFKSVDIIDQIGKEIAPHGLKVTNVADAYAIYWINAWEAAHGIVGKKEITTRVVAVRNQALRAFNSTPTFASATNANRQEFAEMLLIQALLISANMESAENNEPLQRQLSIAIKQGATAMGLDLDAMTLTDQGFVPSGKTGAADPAPGAPEQALAANTAPVPAAANDTSPPYLLMAAAGGAGIGGVFLLGKMMGKRG